MHQEEENREERERQLEIEQNKLVEELRILATKVFEEVIELKNSGTSVGEQEANRMWDYLESFDDVNIIANAINNKELDKNLINSLKEANFYLIPGAKNIHAEMKLVGELRRKGKQATKRDLLYAGLSKLSCTTCWTAINMLNEVPATRSVAVLGTHGGTYGNWMIPDWFSPEEKEKLINKLEEIKKKHLLKWRESSSRIPAKWSEFTEKKQKSPEAIGSANVQPSEEGTSEAAIVFQAQSEQESVNSQSSVAVTIHIPLWLAKLCCCGRY